MWSVSSALGKLFFVSGFLPALAFLAACDLVLVPWLYDGQRLVEIEVLGIQGVVYVLGGTFVGFLLLALNTSITRLFERGLLFSGPLKRRNQRRQQERYSALNQYRAAYRKAAEGEGPPARAMAELEAVHRAVEEKFGPAQELPHNPERVMPTALGNVFAVTEDYSYRRYGMDSMVYWPRMITVIPGDYQSKITDLKATLDFLLNLALLAGLFGLGALGVGLWFGTLPEVVYGLLAFGLAYGLYRGGVGSARELGNLVKGSFDLYRGTLLEAYGFSRPETLAEEQEMWLRLASFIQRGEAFYYPEQQEAEEAKGAG